MEQRKHVLLASDVHLFLEMERSFFSRNQVEVTVARHGAEALHSLQAVTPQLVIMNLHMPVMDGAEACRRIKADPELRHIPVILTTHGEDADELERCRAAGCDAIVSRPLNRRNLLQTARRFLDLTERTAPRIPTRMLVHYGPEDRQTLHDFSVNIAAGGVFLETSRPLPVATPLTLEFLIPGAATTIRCRGKVAWVNAADGQLKADFPCGFGVQFVDLAPEEAEAIRDFIAAESPSAG